MRGSYAIAVTGLLGLLALAPGCAEVVLAPECDSTSCDDQNECTDDRCEGGQCVNDDVMDGTSCSVASSPGVCKGGACVPGNCVDVGCNDGNECTIDGMCNAISGECEGGRNVIAGALCSQDGGSVCDGNGQCVDCILAADCPAAGECESTVCTEGVCDTQTVDDGLVCEYMGVSGQCTAGVCGPTTCDPPCTDGNPDDCVEPFCPMDATICDIRPSAVDSDCESNGKPGKCDAFGICDICAGVDCTTTNQCEQDSTCNSATGICNPFENEPVGTPCTHDGGSVCDGSGACVECILPADCPSGGDCEVAVCSPSGVCGTENAEDGTSCEYMGGAGQCAGGVCGPATCTPPCMDGDPTDCIEPFCPMGSTTCDTRPRPINSDCERVGGGDGKCDAAGTCVECNITAHCPMSANECQATTCESNACVNSNTPNWTACSTGTCQNGSCERLFRCTEQGIRDAIATGGGPNRFDCGGPATVVTAALIRIDNDVILDGEGDLTVDANLQHRVFEAVSGVTAELRSLAVTGGSDGAIQNAGNLTLVDCTVSGSTGASGGGLRNFGAGSLALVSSTVSGNTATAQGAGIYNIGELTITDSTLSENMTDGNGGAIVNFGTLNTDGATLSSNTADNFGGGVYSDSNATFVDSTFSGNSARRGGGVYNRTGGVAMFLKSTLSGNTVTEEGGGIRTYQGDTLTITNCTLSGNSAGWGGAAISTAEAGTVVVASTTVSGNTAGTLLDGSAIWSFQTSSFTVSNTLIDGDCVDSSGDVTSGGYNIESPGDTCGFAATGDQPSVPAMSLMLDPLSDNGGPTETHALLSASPAINKIPLASCGASEDQRGVGRPQGPTCDIGSFELQ